MYTLRRISSRGVEMNMSLGDGYTVVESHKCKEEFARTFKMVFNKEYVEDTDAKADEDTKIVYAFVSTEFGEHTYPLFKNQANYIMTESGSTFSNLSWR